MTTNGSRDISVTHLAQIKIWSRKRHLCTACSSRPSQPDPIGPDAQISPTERRVNFCSETADSHGHGDLTWSTGPREDGFPSSRAGSLTTQREVTSSHLTLCG